jgi:hypothetical protein
LILDFANFYLDLRWVPTSMKINFHTYDVLLKLNSFLVWNEYYEMILIMHIIFWNIELNFVYWIIKAFCLFANQAIVYMTLKYLNTCFTFEIHYSCYVVYKCCIKFHLPSRKELFMHKWIIKIMACFHRVSFMYY